MNKKVPTSDIIRKVLKKPTTSKGFALLLGEVKAYCYLIGRGVRDVGMITVGYANSGNHQKNLPIFKAMAEAEGIKILPHKPFGANRKLIWDYYLYVPGKLAKVKRLISLFDKIHASKGLPREATYPLHREIGKLFGYSQKAILTQYPSTKKK